MNPSALHSHRGSVGQPPAGTARSESPRERSMQLYKRTNGNATADAATSSTLAPCRVPATSLQLVTTDDLLLAEASRVAQLARLPRPASATHEINPHLGGVRFIHRRDVVVAVPTPFHSPRPKSAVTARSKAEASDSLKSSYQVAFAPHSPQVGPNQPVKSTRHRPAAKTTVGAPRSVDDVDRYVTSNDAAYRMGVDGSVTQHYKRNMTGADREAIALSPARYSPPPTRTPLPSAFPSRGGTVGYVYSRGSKPIAVYEPDVAFSHPTALGRSCSVNDDLVSPTPPRSTRKHRIQHYPTGMGNPSIHRQMAQRRKGLH